MGLANPLPGRIQAKDEPWLGPPTFRVTATFQDHLDGGRAAGIDMGNGRQGDPFMSMEAGVVTLAGFLGPALVCRVRHPNGDTSGYAHASSLIVSVGQNVARGQQLGTVGMTGADAPHLHGGYTNPAGQEQDWWPMLDQNQESDGMDPSFSPKPNATVTVNKGARHRDLPNLNPAHVAIAADPGGPLGLPLMGTVVGEAVGGNAIWYAYWRPEVDKVYYLHTSVCGPETPWETVAGGECGPAVAAATAPLEKQIITLSATVKAQADKIGDAKAALG